jgi:hypothetical protein
MRDYPTIGIVEPFPNLLGFPTVFVLHVSRETPVALLHRLALVATQAQFLARLAPSHDFIVIPTVHHFLVSDAGHLDCAYLDLPMEELPKLRDDIDV